MKLIISLDVEEEGLFSGRYARVPPGVRNVAQLSRLEFVASEFGLPLTLLVSHAVAIDGPSQRVLRYWRDRHGAEIGAHLHPWSTPPFADLPYPEPIPSDLIPTALLRAKLESLLGALRDHLEVSPLSFRMGRFDLGEKVLSLLPEYGLRLDSSVVPLRRVGDGPDHFLAPPDPYVLTGLGPKSLSLLEAPLTMVPILPGTPQALHRFASAGSRQRRRILFTWFRYAGALGIQPAWYPLLSMMGAAALHRRRGGKVLVMFLHSSELEPGASRSFPTEAAVERLVSKIRMFLRWLTRTGPVEGVTLARLVPPDGPEAECGDSGHGSASCLL